MRRTLGVGVVLLLVALLNPSGVSAQQSGSERASRLGQNYPNPFNPTTRIPFQLFDSDFVEGKPAIVTIRILDIFRRPVAIPSALNHAGDAKVENLEYTMAGSYVAYWHGTDRTGQKVASGIYLLELIVNGERAPPIKMLVAK